MEHQNLANGSAITFTDIISNHKIEIPIIQRDYAQGRISNRINPIRKKFIRDLIYALKDGSKPLHLDFVYGRIDGKNQKLIFARNKEAIENILLAVKGYADQCNIDFDPKIKVPDTINDSVNSNFIPLDGQQRLTTLYLLHWYVLAKIEIENKSKILNQLKGFSYKTRNTTKEFCNFLIKKSSTLGFEPHKSISKVIGESPEFKSIWKKDPSVQGMLTTLDEIHDLIKYADESLLTAYWYNLAKNRRVTFDFLDLDQYEQTDELYVKMNARGKQLTDFEHFKSWLHEYVKSKVIKISEDNWSDKIDTLWLDLFWSNKPENSYEVDGSIYNFIKSVNLYEYILSTKKEPSSKENQNKNAINRELIDKINKNKEEKSFISVTEYEESLFFSSESLNFTFSCLRKLSEIELDILHANLKDITLFPFLGTADKEVKLPSIFLSDSINPSLPDRVFFYAFLLFISESSVDVSKAETIEQLRKWMRICRNIIFNTYIQNPDNFIDAIKSIKELSIHKNEIETVICKENFSIKFFDSQLKEEIRKIGYFKKGENWKKKIVEVENHSYFYGQIDFIFNLLDNKEDYQQFQFYCDKLIRIFNQPEVNDFLFHRLLLSKGDYLVHSNSKFSFCESNIRGLRARQDNWRKVFNDQTKLRFIKEVLDESSSLDISAVSLASYSNNSWATFFINEKYIENLNFLQNRLIDWGSLWDIRLLEKSTFSGKHADLYSHTLYIDLGAEDYNVKYISVNGRRTESNRPKIEIKLAAETISICYEPNYSNDECAFVIDFEITRFVDISDFEVLNNKIVYKMSKEKVAEEYNTASLAIIKLLKSV
ncbi:GmrSD restriction endonuclease domain-containing protein [Lacibacter sp.]|uniref:GmrSD restriction endonuclease domain-containing protein n=1 Tax=Lacibacter sp. TaxID=1915409 RepID=UPI002B4B6141|nr:DUF262 domain-containing protein [Lacibacter sp.]HLP37046.1 DUF262 domain-containing protein [Lacibacter sp.]